MATQLWSSLKTYIWRQKKKTFRAKLDLHYWSHINENFKAHFTNSTAV